METQWNWPIESCGLVSSLLVCRISSLLVFTTDNNDYDVNFVRFISNKFQSFFTIHSNKRHQLIRMCKSLLQRLNILSLSLSLDLLQSVQSSRTAPPISTKLSRPSRKMMLWQSGGWRKFVARRNYFLNQNDYIIMMFCWCWWCCWQSN